ncbi:MAG: AMP-binding protein [Burkholderiaceae bacterium]
MHPYLHARTHPDKIAYLMANGGETVTYRQLDERSNQFAQLLRARGLRAGDRIAILMENHPRFFEVCWGAQRAGIIFTACSTRLTPGEAAYIIGDCQARMVVTSRKLAETAAGLLDQMPNVAHRMMIDGAIDGYEPLEAVMAAMPTTPIADETAGGDMLYSSGTTGRPKGVYVPPESPLIDADNPLIQICRAFYGLGEDSIYLSPAPLYHAAPLRFNMTVMRLGGTCVLMEEFDAARYLELVERHRITHSQVVPTMFVRMLKLPDDVRRRFDLSSLRCVIHAAAPCPIPVKEQMIEWFGPVIWEYYAGTEGNGLTLVNSADWLTHKGTVGRSVLGVIKICGPGGEELPNGESGTIYFADGKPFEYYNDPAKTAESRHPKGWTTLGDVGYVDDELYLYLTDRKAHMIISGGVNIYPQEAENLLVTHPKVLDAAVIGVPNEDFGEEVKAVVQPRDMKDAGPELEAELIAFCRASLSPIKCPRSVDFAVELPRHPTGKLYKRLLRDKYWEGHGSKLV